MDSSFTIALFSGALAGLAVDFTLFPLDTIKTRLQSQAGFAKSGGFKNIYSGIGSIALGSAPGAALFFCSYESVKSQLGNTVSSHMIASIVGEIAACVIRVPTEVVKQRSQANSQLSSLASFKATVATENLRGLYRGYGSTLAREIPFSVLQFPLWEFLKEGWSSQQGSRVESWQAALCGAVAGGFAAALTTPLDVAKTRIMLAVKNVDAAAEANFTVVLRDIYREAGVRGLFSGIAPRVAWISLGGFIFLGVYEKMKYLCGGMI